MHSACPLPTDPAVLPDPPEPPEDVVRAATVVQIAVDDDESAVRIESMLEALGYDVRRVGADGLGEPHSASIRRVAARIARVHRLSASEETVVALILLGFEPAEIAAELAVSVATARWREYSALTKAGTPTREDLLRLALFGRIVRSPRTQGD